MNPLHSDTEPTQETSSTKQLLVALNWILGIGFIYYGFIFLTGLMTYSNYAGLFSILDNVGLYKRPVYMDILVRLKYLIEATLMFSLGALFVPPLKQSVENFVGKKLNYCYKILIVGLFVLLSIGSAICGF